MKEKGIRLLSRIGAADLTLSFQSTAFVLVPSEESASRKRQQKAPETDGKLQ